MSSFNVADNKSDAKSDGKTASNTFAVDDMYAALNVIGGVDVTVNVKKEPGMTLSVTRTDDEESPSKDDDSSISSAPQVKTSYWPAFYNAGKITYNSPLALLPSLFEFVKKGVYRNRETGQLVHDKETVLSVQIGTLVDSKLQTSGHAFGDMNVADARVHLPFEQKRYELVSWVNVIAPLLESKGTTHTDGSAQSYRKRVEDDGSQKVKCLRMCSHVQRVAVYAPASRGMNGESASQAICFDFYSLVTSHYLDALTMMKILQRGLLVWDITVKANGVTSHPTVCGIAGLLEVMALSNIRATYGLSAPNKITTKTRSYPTCDNLTGGIFGLLYNYVVQGILAREASPESAATAAAASDVNRVAEAEARVAAADARAAAAEARAAAMEEQLSHQTARANANAAEVVLLKKKNADLARTVQTLVVSGRAAEEALKAKDVRDAKIAAAMPKLTPQQFYDGMKNTFAQPVRMPRLETDVKTPAAVATPPVATAAAAAPQALTGVAVSTVRPPSARVAPTRVASNQPAGYTPTGNDMKDS